MEVKMTDDTIEANERINWLHSTPMILIHLTPLLAFWTGTRMIDWIVCVALYWIRMFFLTAGYHRYFSHRSFKTTRAMQFLLALGGGLAANKGVLWWSANHRRHHKHSDEEGDVHSPTRGFWWSHIKWILCGKHKTTELDWVPDLAKYPELRWQNRWWIVPPVALALGCLWLGGWSCLIIGFFLSTVVLWHSVFTINSLAHVWGSRRFDTEKDGSRNNAVLAITTMGEGWHNNHHHIQSSVRQGFYWWEIDVTWYIIKMMSWCRLVWGLKEPTKRQLESDRIADGVVDRGREAYKNAKRHWRETRKKARRYVDKKKKEVGEAIDSAKQKAEAAIAPVRPEND
jgi:stearoyl-CoA desaturase (delta-9 desaturase)